jgi:hypothetical protein
MKHEANPDALRFRHAPDVVARRIRGELLLVPVRRTSADLDGFFTLNATAADIWRLVGERKTVDEISRHLCEHHAVAKEEADRDVARILAELVDAGALITSEAET